MARICQPGNDLARLARLPAGLTWRNIMTSMHQFMRYGLLLAAATALTDLRGEKIPDEFKIGGFAIGAQAYTFNRFSVFEAIEKTAAAGGKVIEFYPGQKLSADDPSVKWDHNASEEIIQKVKDKLAKHKIKAVNYGVVGIPKDEAAARKIFEFAKTLGLYAVTTESTDSIDTIEKMVKEFDIKVAYHNHPRQPRNPNYKVWDPNYILSLVKDRDSRIGACADTGHWLTSEVDPVEAIKLLKGRVISSHLKDRNVRGASGHHDVPFGTGVGNIGGVLDELQRQGFDGNISIEYEYNWNESVVDVAQCIGFVRGHVGGGEASKR
ncbi:MAG: sugar phosphate isomerase/epimerase [Verrucomicrobia bacterium]|nr:sugar phosphate isomerase/epimerase [Verrucomicrobiota bacterium]